MATTQTLNAKYPNWTPEDWERFYWINSWDRRKRIRAPLVPCQQCGGKAIFSDDEADMPYHHLYSLGCQRCDRYLETEVYARFEHLSGFGINSVSIAVSKTHRQPRDMVNQWNYLNRRKTFWKNN